MDAHRLSYNLPGDDISGDLAGFLGDVSLMVIGLLAMIILSFCGGVLLASAFKNVYHEILDIFLFGFVSCGGILCFLAFRIIRMWHDRRFG